MQAITAAAARQRQIIRDEKAAAVGGRAERPEAARRYILFDTRQGVAF